MPPLAQGPIYAEKGDRPSVSPATEALIDKEVSRLVREGYQRALAILVSPPLPPRVRTPGASAITGGTAAALRALMACMRQPVPPRRCISRVRHTPLRK